MDDDADDREIFHEAYDSLHYQNRLVMFKSGMEAFNYLKGLHARPFLVISDINMPVMDGYALRDKITADKELAAMGFPFIFYSTATDPETVKRCKNNSYQGLFEKQYDFSKIKATLDSIIKYWVLAIP